MEKLQHQESLLEEHLFKHLASPGLEKGWMTLEVNSQSLIVRFSMKSINKDRLLEIALLALSGRMCQESSTAKTTHLGVSLGKLVAKEENLPPQEENGVQEAILRDEQGRLRGEFWTRSISESPKDAEECSLLEVLDQEESIPEECYLNNANMITTAKEYVLGRGEVLLRSHAGVQAMQTAEALRLFLEKGGDVSRLKKKKDGKVSSLVGQMLECLAQEGRDIKQ